VMHYFISHANLGVSYFFVLSGFILTLVYPPVFFKVKGAFKKFLVARFARIYPVYFLALILAIASVLLYRKFQFNLAAAISNATLMQAWIPQHVKVFNRPGWSLSAEAFFYIVFPFLVFAFYRLSLLRTVIITALAWVVSFAILIFLIQGVDGSNLDNVLMATNSNPLLQLNNFIIGIAGGIMFLRNKLWPIKKYPGIFLACSLLLMLLLFFIPNALTEHAQNGFFAPLFLLFIVSLSYSKGVICKVLSNGFFVYLGEISYSVYILQIPLSLWYSGLIRKANLSLTPVELIYSYIVFLVLFSAIIFNWFEKPLRKFLRTAI